MHNFCTIYACVFFLLNKSNCRLSKSSSSSVFDFLRIRFHGIKPSTTLWLAAPIRHQFVLVRHPVFMFKNKTLLFSCWRSIEPDVFPSICRVNHDFVMVLLKFRFNKYPKNFLISHFGKEPSPRKFCQIFLFFIMTQFR